MTRMEELLYKFKEDVLKPFPFLKDEGYKQFFWVVFVLNMFVPTVLYLVVEYDKAMLPPIPENYLRFFYAFLFTFPLFWTPFMNIIYERKLSLQSITCFLLFIILIILHAAVTIL